MFALKAKNGTVVEVPEEYISGLSMESVGYCIHCGEEAYCIEPDAEKYECDSCGKHGVYGAEQLLLMGRIA